MELNTHGGKRAGAGRQKQGKVKVCITMTPAHFAATAGNRSAKIEQALDKMLGPDAEKGKSRPTFKIQKNGN